VTGTNEMDQLAMQRAYKSIAAITGQSVGEVAAMTKDEMIDHIARTSFRTFALKVTYGHGLSDSVTLMDEGPEEQAERVAKSLTKFHATTPLFPIHDRTINLFGFGQAPVHFVAYGDDGNATEEYLLLSEVAEALGIPLHKADKWARQDQADALSSQRERDEERGQLGWECLRDLVDLQLWITVDDPEANPDAGGKRWSHAGDWLISHDRLMAFMTISPWSREFIDNAAPLFGHAFRATMGDQLKGIPTYTADGQPTGSNAYDGLARTDGLTVEEAAKRAFRGPGIHTDNE
jgi:hypothetical protein